MKSKKKWLGSYVYRINQYPPVPFLGRGRVKISDDNHRKALLSLGVFVEESPGIIYYAAPYIIDKGGAHIEVDKDGYAEADWEMTTPEAKKFLDKELK